MGWARLTNDRLRSAQTMLGDASCQYDRLATYQPPADIAVDRVLIQTSTPFAGQPRLHEDFGYWSGRLMCCSLQRRRYSTLPFTHLWDLPSMPQYR